MKIHPDQLKALEQEQSKSGKSQKADKGFGDMLAKEMGKAEEGAKAHKAAAVPPPGAGLLPGQVLAAQAAAGTGESTESGRQVMESLENLMSDWESYAARLESSTGSPNLRQAEGMLGRIESGVEEIRKQMPEGGSGNSELDAFVNEVEVLAVTERIKFNRGDYI